jgi:dTDP-4-dehydrorhamnose reductase
VVSRAYLVAGAGGMLGTALQRVLEERAAAGEGVRFGAPAEGQFDITDTDSAARTAFDFVAVLGADEEPVLVNAAAYTNVERAEDEPDVAYSVNEDGARKLAFIAREAGMRFVHVSTDFVFDGTKDGPYIETDEPNPLSVYGASKLAGELAVAWENPDALVVRTAWVFGTGGAGANFPLKVLARARSGEPVRVVTDEVGSPTYTIDLARGILGLVAAGASGLFHLAGAGSCSRHDLAIEVLRLAGFGDMPIEQASSADFPSKAQRPANSVLDCSKAAALGVRMPEWRDAVGRFVGELRTSGSLRG